MVLHGKNVIATRLSTEGKESLYAYDAQTGEELLPAFYHATKNEIQNAVQAAELATAEISSYTSGDRARLLRAIAENIIGLGDALIDRCNRETGLPAGRLESERTRTANQLRMFADLIDEGSWVDARIDTAIPDRQPLPKPDIRRILAPIGPVAVFCASNFPLAFSVAGGDTASALAAGNGVIVKSHSSHPGTAELVAGAISDAIKSEGMPLGLFSLVHGPGSQTGIALVTNSGVRAAGFTGSKVGGRALFDAAAGRENPIPVYAEMGSINPVFVLPGALSERGEEIAEGLQGSITLGVGQFCTNPGLVVGLQSPAMEQFIDKTGSLISKAPGGTMLNAKIRTAYEQGVNRLSDTQGVSAACGPGAVADQSKNQGVPALFRTSVATFLADGGLSEEVFGPASLVVEGTSKSDLMRIAEALDGHLTATIHGTEADLRDYADLVRTLESKVGRVIFNGFPTGVEVCPSMNHGGPYPATTDVHYTSVGTAAIFRFVRPICYQGFPDEALPPALKNGNPLRLMRTVNGKTTRNPVG